MLHRMLFALLLAAAATVAAAPPPAVQEVVLRHALSGESAALLVSLVGRYNAESKDGKVVLQHVSMAEDLRHLPHFALMDDDEYQKFFDSRPRMIPLHKVMADAKERLDVASFYPVLVDVVDDNKGRIQALPLAQSVPVLFYNKDAFRKARLDPERPPKTWMEVQATAGKLFDAGYRCPLTSTNMAWVHLENVSTQHGEPMANSEKPGKSMLALNGLVQVKHVAMLASWYKSFYFHYFGHGREADDKFVSGACSMLTSDSSLFVRLARARPFAIGMADLPYYDDVRGAAPGRVLPDGPALWVLAGKKAPEYKAVAHFVSFLLKPEVQKEWVRTTGYLPMMPAAAEAFAADGVPAEVLRATVQRLAEKKMVSAARPKAMLGLSRVRAILNEELEAVWSNRKPSKEALDSAVLRGNAVLEPAPADGTAGR
jgi:sn-glycerol 3-phosphate transport system substrate-binding protein